MSGHCEIRDSNAKRRVRSLRSHAYHGQYDSIKRRKLTQGRQESFQKLSLRGYVISLVRNFRKNSVETSSKMQTTVAVWHLYRTAGTRKPIGSGAR